ncbi:MAG: HAMP domain-containing sensor histidine kinase [Solirubrobacteraceae bacterium]|nr:HAMP domain-containing sensor histidine kinase [Patulibacter sp.]
MTVSASSELFGARRSRQGAALWSAAVFVAALAATMLLVWFKFDAWKPTYWIAICVAPSSAIALIVAHLVRNDPSRMRSLAQRFTLSVLLTLGPIAFAAWASARMMGITSGDAIVVSAVLVMALAVGARISYLLSFDVRTNVDALRAGLAQVATGRRDVVFPVDARDEIGTLAAQAQETVAMLTEEEKRRDEAERMRRETIASISHDLRTPITSLRLLAEAIEDDLVDQETVKRYAASMRTNVEVLGALIDDLFELARIEAGALTWSMQQFELGEIVESVIGTMEVEAHQRGIRINAEAAGSTDFVGDPARLRRVMLNLLQNAVRHTPEDGSVTVKIEPRTGGGFEVEVADDGEGIDPADRERIFEPFYRGGSEAARTRPGTGLGLAIARAVVEAHGGRIWLADSDHGSRFRFSLSQGTVSAAA